MRLSTFALALTLAVPAGLGAQQDRMRVALDDLELREIGPAVMGGRVADLAVVEDDPSTFYVGFASGGLWRTTNQGMSWEPLFDDQPTLSIGAVSLAPSNPNVIWVGTGEPQNRQSSPYGAGVFRSVDAGDTWQDLGLKETRHIGGIVVHPSDPDVAYVAAVGHLFGPNEERGVYRTRDGGQSWEKVLYIDEHTGAIDIVMHPTDPKTIFAAMYQRQRTPWGFSASGSGSGLYRTLDGGDSWHELTDGLPEGDKGRIGLDIYRRDGNLVYALVESSGDGRGLYRSTDRGDSWEKVSDHNPRPMYFSLVRIDPNNPDRIYTGGVELPISDDGGKTWWEGDGAAGIHVDHHALWIDPNDSDHVILGNDGGVATTFDGAKTWRHHNNLAVGQFYQIGVDMRDPYYVCGGLQDNSSWCGPSRTLDEYGIRNEDWYDVWGGDGFYNVVDPSDPMIMYTESQNGNLGRYHVDTGESARIRPEARPTGDDEDRSYRWNWNTPIHISKHDPATVYVGSNHLLRSRDRGQSWEEASPDLTRAVDRDTLEIMGELVTRQTLSRHDGTSMYSTIVEIGESPLDPNVIYVGTDDGVLQVTRDGGRTWTDLSRRLRDLEHGQVVSGIEPSHHEPGRVYVSFDGHWNDDYAPHVYVSDDYGRSWDEITDGLPEGSVNDVAEHHRTPGLLFVGSESGLFVSTDRGERWLRMADNFPHVPVDEIVIHPRDNDLVVGTHGRSIWILDDLAPLEQMTRPQVLASAAHLFPVPTATMWSIAGGWPFWGDIFAADNPPVGAVIRYWLGSDVAPATVTAADDEAGSGPSTAGSAAAGPLGRPAGAAAAGRQAADEPVVTLTVFDSDGRIVREMEGPGEMGLHEVVWDFRENPPYETDEEPGGWRGPPAGPLVLPGTYSVRMSAGGVTQTAEVVVRQDPRVDAPMDVLARRQQTVRRALALAEPAYRAGEAVEKAEAQLEAARELLDDAASAPADLLARADSLADRLDEISDAIGDADDGVRTTFSIESYSGPATADQLWEIEQSYERLPGAIRDLNAFLIDELNPFIDRVYQPATRPARIEPVAVPGAGGM